MQKATIPIDLRQQVFSRADSSFYLFEEDDREGLGLEKGLWFGVSVSDGAARREGLIRIVPVIEREPVQVTVKATPCSLELTAGEASLVMAMDTPGSMRIYGKGLGIMIHKEMPVMSLETIIEVRPGVADYNLFVPTGGGGRLVFTRISGAFEVDSKAGLTANGVNVSTIWIEPGEDGCSETLVTGTVPMAENPVSVPLKDVLTEVSGAFEAFCASLPPLPKDEKTAALLVQCAYAMWIARRPAAEGRAYAPMQKPMFCRSRVTDTQCGSRFQPLFAAAMVKKEDAVAAASGVFPTVKAGMLPEVVCTTKLRYAHFPLLHGYALARAFDKGGSPTGEEAAALYAVLRPVLERAVEAHSFAEGRLSCLTPAELSLPASAPEGASFPLETPELYTRMIFLAELVGRLERIAGEGDGVSWFELSRRWLAILTDELWDGAAFRCRETITGRLVKDESLLGLSPVLLGLRLPETVMNKLAEALASPRFLGEHGLASLAADSARFRADAAGQGAVDLISNGLCILGLSDARRFAQAKELAARLLRDAEKDGAAPTRAFDSGTRDTVRPGDAFDAPTAAVLIAAAAAAR